MSTAAHTAGKKAILMVGGSGAVTGWEGAASDTNRAKFVTNLLAKMTEYGMDGLDLDWEPISKTDEPLLLQLVKDLRKAKPSIILTIPLDWTSASTVFKDIAPYVDQLNIMSYQMADGEGAGWSGWTLWHSSALDGEGSTNPSSIQKSVDAYLAAGVPAAKLGVGIGAYGSGWAGPQTVGQSTAGYKVVAGDGELGYTNLTKSYITVTNVKRDTATTGAQVPYVSTSTGIGSKKLTFISYEDPTSVAVKMAWVKAKGLGGTILWTGSQSYDPVTKKNTILEAAKKTLIG